MSCHGCGEFTDDLMFACVCGATEWCAPCGYELCGDYNPRDKAYDECKVCSALKTAYINPTLSETNNEMLSSVGGGWSRFFTNPKIVEIVQIISNLLRRKRNAHNVAIYPRPCDVFNAFKLCPLESVRVVIIGQDCYHGEGQAMGLSFSVRPGIRPPPSLVNIYKELENDGFTIKDKSSGDLTLWAKRGVFLYNTALTVEHATPGSHIKWWKHFSELVISHLLSETRGIVFILWGAEAQSLSKEIMASNRSHHILSSSHPSPFSVHRGFFGSRPFSRANAFLKMPIDWNL